MGQTRWRDRLGPPSFVLSTGLMIAVIVPTAIAAGPPPTPGIPAACPSFDAAAVASAATGGSAEAPGAKSETVLDAVGVMTGRRMSLQPRRAGPPVSVTLPTESFVAPAAGDVVVYGWHRPESGSEIRAIDAVSGCDGLLARPPEVVRSASLDPTGTSLYVHSVDAADRRDLGITRYDLATGTSSLVLEPVSPSKKIGPTFATELRWSLEGDALAIQSCGISACRTRVLETAGGDVETHEGAGHGAIVGLTDADLFVFDRCHWAPCALLAIDRASGAVRQLFDEAFEATLAQTAGRAMLTVETSAGITEVLP